MKLKRTALHFFYVGCFYYKVLPVKISKNLQTLYSLLFETEKLRKF